MKALLPGRKVPSALGDGAATLFTLRDVALCKRHGAPHLAFLRPFGDRSPSSSAGDRRPDDGGTR